MKSVNEYINVGLFKRLNSERIMRISKNITKVIGILCRNRWKIQSPTFSAKYRTSQLVHMFVESIDTMP